MFLPPTLRKFPLSQLLFKILTYMFEQNRALYLALLIYAGIGYHRQRKNMRLGNYALTYNHDLPTYHGSGAAPQHTAYHPQYYAPQSVKPANMV